MAGFWQKFAFTAAALLALNLRAEPVELIFVGDIMLDDGPARVIAAGRDPLAAFAPILAAAQMNYRRPIGWPERLRIVMFPERIGGKSLTLGHRIESATQPGVLYADGNTVLVWVDRSGAPMALPEFVRAAVA